MGDFERRWSYATYYRYPDELKEGMTDAEVLAEMGGERRWQCRFVTSRNAFFCTQHHSHKGCGWVWIVKEADDE